MACCGAAPLSLEADVEEFRRQFYWRFWLWIIVAVLLMVVVFGWLLKPSVPCTPIDTPWLHND